MALRVRVCSVTDVGDQPRAFAVEGVTWPVLVVRLEGDDGEAGDIVATPGVCPHEDVELAGGKLVGCELTCPGHSYVFDLRTGACEHDPTLTLRRYRVTIVDGDVWVDLLSAPISAET